MLFRIVSVGIEKHNIPRGRHSSRRENIAEYLSSRHVQSLRLPGQYSLGRVRRTGPRVPVAPRFQP